MIPKRIFRIVVFIVFSLVLSGIPGMVVSARTEVSTLAASEPRATIPARTVSDVVVKSGTGCNSGYDYIPIDLNEGSGGEYVSLCVQYNGPAPVTGLKLVKVDSKDKNPGYSCPSGYEKSGVDMNLGIAKSKFGISRPVTHLYLCKGRGGSNPIRNIALFSSKESKDIIRQPFGYKPIDDVNTDLNDSVSGNYIHLYYAPSVEGPITDLNVTIADGPFVNPPSGFTQITVDLNQGSGGKFIYLDYLKGGNKDPISDIKVISGEDAKCPSGYTKIDKDLNKGSGGEYLYLCYQRSKSASPIVDIRIYSVEKDYQSVLNTSPYGYVSTKTDLNKGAGGRYIYLYFLRKYK